MISLREQIYFCNFVPENCTMNTLRRTGLTLLAALVLLSTTGFNVWHHICGCEFASESLHPHSCCEKESAVPIDEGEPCNDGCGHDHSGCRNIPVYYKAPIVAVSQVSKTIVPDILPPLLCEIAPVQSETDQAPQDAAIVRFGHPPLMTGRDLVCFLHQLRIPDAS